MSKDVVFNIKLRIDGKEHLVTASTNTQELAKQLGMAKSNSDKLRQSLLHFNQVTQALQNLTSGLSQVAGVARQYTEANKVQVEAENKLATVMRNTMNASDAEVQSIKELASAQQKLGVIGDEVQLAGAGQLAVFVKQQSNLQALIPIMNDMIAKQQGLNATQEGAVSIASMLGKALNGTTTTLERAGYVLIDAQKEILKTGSEEQKVAVLSDVVSKAVGGMNAELAKTDAGRAQQAANSFGDLRERIGAIIGPLETMIVQVGEVGLAFNAIATTIGGLSSSIRILFGLTNTASMFSFNTKIATSMVRFFTTAMNMSTVSIATANTAIKGLTWSLRALEVASGIGVAFAALSVVFDLLGASVPKAKEASDSLGNLRRKTEELNQSEQNQATSIAKTRSELELNIAKLKDFNGTKQQEKTLVEEMNNKYGETMGYFNSVSDWYKALIANSEAYCKQMIAEAKARSLANQIANIEEENRIIGQNIVNDKYSKENEKKKEKVVSGTTSWGSVNTYTIEVDVEGTSELDKARAQIQDNYSRIDDAKKEMQAVLKEMGDTAMQIQGAANRPTGGTGDSTASDKQLIMDPKTYKDLQNNVSYYDQELKKANVEDRATIENLYEKKAAAEQAVRTFEMLSNKPPVLEVVDSSTLSSLTNLKSVLDDLKDMKLDLHVDLDEERVREITEQWLKMQNAMQTMETMEGVSKIAASVSQLGQSMAGLSEESRGLQVAMAGVSVAAAIAQLIAVMVKKLSESFTIWDFIAGTIAGTAAVVSAITQLKNVAAFAQGGIVSGPTMALVGEYVGAQNNPEVIAPLDKLRSMIEPAGFDGGNVHFKIAGRDLVGVIEKEYNHNKRS